MWYPTLYAQSGSVSHFSLRINWLFLNQRIPILTGHFYTGLYPFRVQYFYCIFNACDGRVSLLCAECVIFFEVSSNIRYRFMVSNIMQWHNITITVYGARGYWTGFNLHKKRHVFYLSIRARLPNCYCIAYSFVTYKNVGKCKLKLWLWISIVF